MPLCEINNKPQLNGGFTMKEKTTVTIMVIISMVGIVGWVWNIAKLISMEVLPLTTIFIVRAIGIFVPPLGAVMGFL